MRRQRGFTLIEVLITVPIFMLVIAGIITFMVNLYVQILVKDARTEMALEAQTTLNNLQNDLFFGRNFAAQPNGSMVDANGPQGTAQSWNFNTTPSTLIVYQIALDSPYQSGSRQVVYQKAAASGYSCDPSTIEQNPPVLNNLIYYIDAANNLRRRVLVPDPVNQRCSNPFLAQSCPTASTRVQQVTQTTTATVPCPADSTLATGVVAFTVTYYDADGNVINTGSGGSPLQAERVTIDITLSRTVAGDTSTYSAEFNVKKMNKGDPNIQ